MTAPTETLKFKVGLSATYWDKKPQYEVLVNDVKQAEGFADKETTYIEFSCDLQEEVAHKLQIKLLNKTNDQVKKEPPVGDPYVIVADQLLNIDSIEIDDIDVGVLKWDASTYTNEANEVIVERCTNLGVNGTYTFTFTSPFYLWLLENM